MLGASYKSKKDLKASVGQELNYIETSLFGPEYLPTGTFCVVGPCPFTKRTWFAEVQMENGKIKKVK